ncbi:MAG: hypothetical protein LUC94_01025 [Clostridiales bacterium]|nr:hypothetical protein [Clostridiales bacterium]
MRLKYAYQKKSAYINNCHGYQSNRIVESCASLTKEPMNYQALAKRAKETSRQDKLSAVKKKDGSVRMVHKFKRTKRYGGSIGRRAPAAFINMVERKMARYGGTVTDVDICAYRASQYDHTTGTYKKPELSDRTKMIGGHLVQRDLYSAFLLMNQKDNTAPDQERCEKTFDRFLKNQEAAVFEAMISGDPTGNFGLKDFIQRTPA